MIVCIHFQKFVHCPFSGFHQITRFKHKWQIGFRHFERFLLTLHKFLVWLWVRTVRSHRRMQRWATGTKASSLCVILSADVAHELRHTVAVVVGRFKSVLCHQPARREYHEIKSGHPVINLSIPFSVRFACENWKYAGIRVVKGNWPNRVVEIQVIFAGRVVSFPTHYIVGRKFALAFENLANIFVINLNKDLYTFHSYFLS